jgi:hypothetical protein
LAGATRGLHGIKPESAAAKRQHRAFPRVAKGYPLARGNAASRINVRQQEVVWTLAIERAQIKV